jgi:hypothetical protein
MKFEVDGTEYTFVESPTFGEARAIEKVTGVSFADMGKPTVDTIQAQLWISMRRVDPAVTFDDLDDIDMAVLSGLVEGVQAAAADAEVPTDAEDAMTSAPSA